MLRQNPLICRSTSQSIPPRIRFDAYHFPVAIDFACPSVRASDIDVNHPLSGVAAKTHTHHGGRDETALENSRRARRCGRSRWLGLRWRHRPTRTRASFAARNTVRAQYETAASRQWSNVRRRSPDATASVRAIRSCPTTAAPLPISQSTRLRRPSGILL
jgi:hypothetical protein